MGGAIQTESVSPELDKQNTALCGMEEESVKSRSQRQHRLHTLSYVKTAETIQPPQTKTVVAL